jgi:hypothetical protein
MDPEAESIAVGPYLLEVGGEAGTLIEKGGSDHGDETEALRTALGEPESKAEDGAAVATEVEAASEATAKIERAVALCKGIGEGQALNPAQLGLEVGALLDCLEKLDRKKEHKKSLQMARALATLLMLLKRWADLLQTLRIALRAGEKLDDLGAVAWAKHELGTLHLAAGDVEGADRNLRRAREIRERIGDRRGLAATERNMRVLCDHLRSMLQNGELVRPGPPNRRTARLLALAGVFVVLFGGGIAAGMMVGDDPGPEGPDGAITETQGVSDTSEVDTDTNPDGDGETDDPTLFALAVSIAGDGNGSVEGGGIECPEGACKVEIRADETVTLTAQPDANFHLESFSGDCSGTSCTLTMTGPMSVTATFIKGSEPESTGDGDTTEGELGEEEEEEEEEETSPEIIE